MNIINTFLTKALKQDHSRDPEAIAILKKIQKLKIRFALGGSYAMRRYRPIHDFDIMVHIDDWQTLLNSNLGSLRVAQVSGNPMYFILTHQHRIEMSFFKDSFPGPGFTYLDLQKEGYNITEDGFECWTMEQMIRWKKRFGRAKDIRDLNLLDHKALKKYSESRTLM